MIIRENISLATLTTLRVGGDARYVLECTSKEDVLEAVTFAQERELLWSVLGEGSNILASDEGYDGVVIALRIPGMDAAPSENSVLLTAGAGVTWDALVREAADQELWGLENLAGIPGTVGAAPVQNIGAYGAEVKDTLHTVEVLDTKTGSIKVFTNDECAFAYRDSRFKHEVRYIILSVSFLLSQVGQPDLAYKDLAAVYEQGEDLATPRAIGDSVRAIRGRKFPDLNEVGTAGSFFKNPTITKEAYTALKERYVDLPGFPNESGVKIPLAFILDKVLNLRGYTDGNVSLFENQPLVLVANSGATQKEIDTFAVRIASRVMDATGIVIEREVRDFSS